MDYKQQRKEIAYFMRRLYHRGLTTSSAGNVSALLEEGLIGVTAGSTDKARIRWKDIALMNLDGEVRTPECRPSSEVKMHTRIYQECPRVRAVVHAHPTYASTFTAAETPINTSLIAEAHAVLGVPKVASYARTGTDKLADIVADCARTAHCVLLENHGITCVGETLLEAFDRLEMLEAAAKMTIISSSLEGVRDLSPQQKAELEDYVENG